MSKKKTTEEFIKEATLLHNNYYDYSLVNYTGAHSKITIICPIHGKFEQKANTHLNGSGCRKCGVAKAHSTTRGSTEDFTTKAKKVHKNLYSYTKTNYTKASTPVVVTCKIHGDFTVIPSAHLQGSHCPKCSKELRAKNQTKTTPQFVEEAKNRHNNYYDYLKTTYVNDKSKVIITCPQHGDFTQTPNSHLAGQGCPKCAKERKGWSYSQWETQGTSSNYFDSFKLYVIKCKNAEEEFIKIGKTFQTIGRRFQDKSTLPYSWELLSIKIGDARTISIEEHKLHTKLKQYSYTPLLPFGGQTECFTVDAIAFI